MTRVTFTDAVDIAAFKAAVFDLDGVVTRTAELHSEAWKALFDGFLAERAAAGLEPFVAFSDVDYLAYVDGKPRTQGVADFLRAREIDLPMGSPEDPPTAETCWGLGTRKNDLFLRILERDGIELYQSTVSLIRRLRGMGLRTALVTSSENGAAMLEQAGISDLFDARVDGRDARRLGLQGKPHPDVFEAAVRALGVRPCQALAVEDALSGVASAAAAGYRLVIGIDRSGSLARQLQAQGAHLVLPDLAMLRLIEPQLRDALPSALEVPDQWLAPNASGRELCLFLDYDGTLAQIADRPEQARLSESVRRLLRALATRVTVAVVSGRDRRELERMLALPEVYCVGSHGLDVRGPGGMLWHHDDALASIPALDRAQRQLEQAIGEIPGVLVERKRFALAVHFRLVEASAVDRVRVAAADAVRRAAANLRLTGGKCVVELRPCLPWDKGEAVHWLLQNLPRSDAPLAVFVGDDETDEDAFRMMRRLGGVGICVGDGALRTFATLRLESPAQVESLLEKFVELVRPYTQQTRKGESQIS